MEEIIEKINCNKKFQEILKNIKQKTSPITLLGLSDYAKTYIPCIVKKEIKEPICIITYNELQAKAILENAKKFDLNVIYFPRCCCRGLVSMSGEMLLLKLQRRPL